MRIEAGLERAVAVALVAIALVGAAAMISFALHAQLPDAVLPAAIVAAVAAVWWRSRDRVELPAMSGRDLRWCGAAVVLLAATTAILAWGALATTSRHWDGAAMWDAKARVLSATLSLEQPAFRDPAVYCHSRDYPLLQPVLMALLERTIGCGRVLFPTLYALQCCLLFTAMRRLGASGSMSALSAVAWGVTPMVMNPTGGGFDSGYADAFLAVAVTAAVAGIVVRDRVWLITGILIGVWVKPEGALYGAIVVALAWLGTDRVTLRSATWAWAASLASWSLVQNDLNTFAAGPAPWLLLAALSLLGVVLPLVHPLLRALRTRLVVGALAVITLVALIAIGGAAGTWGAYVGQPERSLARLTSLPEITASLVGNALLRGQFGLLFLLPFAVLLARGGDATRRAPWHWLACMVAVVHAPFLLAPLDDLQHHLRSTMPRLLFHNLGVAALATGLLLVDRGDANARVAAGTIAKVSR